MGITRDKSTKIVGFGGPFLWDIRLWEPTGLLLVVGQRFGVRKHAATKHPFFFEPETVELQYYIIYIYINEGFFH